MSRTVLSKLDIDVLVQLAWVGPSDVDRWTPLTQDPTALGTLLWSRNHETAAWHSDDPPMPDYVFDPLPITVTSAEGVRQCDYYTYQTAAEEPGWRRGGVGQLLDHLRETLLGSVPAIADAPWGWSAAALTERADRTAPELPVPREPDGRVLRVFAQWHEVGLELTELALDPDVLNSLSDPRAVLARGGHRPTGHSGFMPIIVSVCAGEDSAREVYVAEVQRSQRFRGLHGDVHVYRFGSAVAVTTFFPPHEAAFIQETDSRIAELGAPSDHWWSRAPSVAQLDATIAANEVRLSMNRWGRHSGPTAVVARTPAQLKILATFVADEQIGQSIAQVNTRKQSVIVLCGVTELLNVDHVRVVDDLVNDASGPRVAHRVIVDGDATAAIATLLIVDRLPEMPVALNVPMLGWRLPVNPPIPRVGG